MVVQTVGLLRTQLMDLKLHLEDAKESTFEFDYKMFVKRGIKLIKQILEGKMFNNKTKPTSS